MTKYLSLQEITEIQDVLIREFGGINGVRDIGALESAVMRPQTGYYETLLDEAAALM